MLLTPLSRLDLLDVLPAAAEVAEVGTYRGVFANEIAQRAEPIRLHVIDPWGSGEEEYAVRYNLPDGLQGDYQEAMERLKPGIDSGRVVVHRRYSSAAAGRFVDASLDWIYIDALHTYEACLEDLELFDSKVKPDGLILGHDFSNTPLGRKVEFGVIKAVREFVAARGYEILAVTVEAAPSYVIAKGPSERRDEFLRALVAADPRVIDVPVEFYDGFDQYPFDTGAKRRPQIFRFRPASSHDHGNDDRGSHSGLRPGRLGDLLGRLKPRRNIETR